MQLTPWKTLHNDLLSVSGCFSLFILLSSTVDTVIMHAQARSTTHTHAHKPV